MSKDKLQLVTGRPFQQVFDQFRGQPRLSELQVLGDLSARRFFDEIEPAHYPVIFQQQTDLPSADTLLSDLAAEKINVQVRAGRYANPEVTIHDREYIDLPLSEYISDHLFVDSNTTELPPYAARIPSQLQTLRNIRPPFYPAEELEAPFTWLGPKGCVSSLHKDSTSNFAMHVFGAKRWTLFPPRDAPLLYLRRVIESSDFAVSRIDLRYSADRSEFPLLIDAHSVTVDVKSNQVLYVPEGWAHFVENLEPTLMLNFWRIRHFNGALTK